MNEYLLDYTGSMADLMPGFTVREDSGHMIIRAVGEIDAYSAPALTATIRKQIRDGHHRLIVDLSGVPFLDSSGLGALVGGYKRTKAHPDGRFAVVGPCKRFLEILRITGLVRVLPVYESLGHVFQAHDLEPHAAGRHHLGRHAGTSAASATAATPKIPSPTPAPADIPAYARAEAEAEAATATTAPTLACDRDTLLHLAGLGDVDALVERSLLFGSGQRPAAAPAGS